MFKPPKLGCIAICVGLWLAEGDTKTLSEITFTNNCFELVILFHRILKENFLDKHHNPRIYVYSPRKFQTKPSKLLRKVIFKYYVDRRARKPYYIYRVASKDTTKEWHKSVEKIKRIKSGWKFVLMGFFAGEGNIKHLLKNHMHRSIRIAQKNRNHFLEEMLDFFNFTYSFSKGDRCYNITGRENLFKAKTLEICNLHPLKKIAFKEMLKSYKSDFSYYPKGWLKQGVYFSLSRPKTTRELSIKFKRSFARIQDVLIELKKEKRVINYRCDHESYWLKGGNGVDTGDR